MRTLYLLVLLAISSQTCFGDDVDVIDDSLKEAQVKTRMLYSQSADAFDSFGNSFGRDSHLGMLPYLVFFKFNRTNEIPVYGGSIIGSKFILTAGRAIRGVTKFTVVAGCIRWNATNCKEYDVAKTVLYPGSEFLNNDVAVIVLTEKICYNEYVQPIPLTNKVIPRDAVLTMTGFMNNSNTLNWVNVRSIASFEEETMCQDWYSQTIDTSTRVCTVPGRTIKTGVYGFPIIMNEMQVGISYDWYPVDFVFRIEPYLYFIFGVMDANK